jgi:hypothetical protein
MAFLQIALLAFGVSAQSLWAVSEETLYQDVAESKQWNRNVPSGQWTLVSADPVLASLQQPGTLFGFRPQRLFVFCDVAGKVDQAVIVFLETGYSINPWAPVPDWKKRRYEADFQKMAQGLPLQLEKAAGGKGEGCQLTANAGNFVFDITEYHVGKVLLRLYIEDKRSICLQIVKQGTPRDLYPGIDMPTDKRKEALAQNVKRNANGDVLVAHVPEIDQDGRPYCGPAVWTEIARYYGLNVYQEMMLSNGRDGGWGVGEAADLTVELDHTFDFAQVQKSIDSGNPVWFCEPGHVALITGYNAKKKEIFRTDSWGEGARNRPVPVDEFSKRANGYLFFTPRE